MRILVEEYQYEAELVREVLHGVDALQNVEGFVSLSYVGYFYNTRLKDCVFILPKVLMDEKGLVFGKYKPESIIHMSQSALNDTERKFLYEFAVWIYRAVAVYQQTHKDSDIIYHRQISQVGHGLRHRANTLLDILLSLIQFSKDNENYITFVLKNLHSGYNKINWTRTISRSTAIVQGGMPIYLNPVNKKRQINFDEELLIIYYSILNHISKEYGFRVDIRVGFPLIEGAKFDAYLNGRGVIRLRQIKYKYFSDTALQLWQLCFAFFAHSTEITTSAELKEYLLVKNFYVVFEAIIDRLIGDPKDELPADFKDQKDGKLVDHLYTYPGLMQADDEQMTYYIGDSKYYKIGGQLGDTSIYKQYTYARNIVQYNLDLWLDDSKPNPSVAVRDEVTEGYNVLPNFFISAAMEKGDYSYNHREIQLTKITNGRNPEVKYQFRDRLFDRDTMLLSRYNVNFLFVIALYARNRQAEISTWKDEVRAEFRRAIREVLANEYHFYPMRSKGINMQEYVAEHFRDLIGKVYTPFEDKDILSLALENTNDPRLQAEQSRLLDMLRKDFTIDENYRLGDIPEVGEPVTFRYTSQDSVLVGYYKDFKHLAWILKNHLYNTRAGSANGSLGLTASAVGAKYLLLHGEQGQRLYVLDGEGPKLWSKADLEKKGYNNPKHDFYLMYGIKDVVQDHDLDMMQFDFDKVNRLLEVEYGRQNIDPKTRRPIAIALTELMNCVLKPGFQPILPD